MFMFYFYTESNLEEFVFQNFSKEHQKTIWDSKSTTQDLFSDTKHDISWRSASDTIGFNFLGLRQVVCYLEEQFHQIACYLGEQFRQIACYLAERFRQIASSF